MTNDQVFRTVAEDFSFEIEEKRSRFLAAVRHVTSVREAEEFVAARRKLHPAARHTVYAYLLRDGTLRAADDAEPQGTAGLPTLEAIRRAGLVDVCVATTRYFGGVLLGTGGLSRAYGAAARGVLDGAQTAEYAPFAVLSLSLTYPDHRRVCAELPRFNGREDSVDFAERVLVRCLVPAALEQSFLSRVTDLTAGRAAAVSGGHVFERK